MSRQISRNWALGALAAGIVCHGALAAFAATPGDPASSVSSVPLPPRPGSYSRLSGTDNPAARFFTRATSPAVAAPQPTAPVAAQAVQIAPAAKPFNTYQQGPSVSPYVALAQQENADSLPVYYTFVQPALAQQRFAQQQQNQNMKLQQQLRSVTAAGAINRGVNGGLPTTGHSTQYFNLGGYYAAPGK